VVVDSSGYGPVTITKSISLIAPRGIHAGISPSSGDAVEVNAGTSGKVVLRNLSLNGANGGRNGVDYNSASSLVVEDCGVANFANHGIERLAKSPDLAQLTVSDTVLRGNGAREGEGGALIARNAGSGSTDVDIDHSRAQLNLSGFEIGDGAKATITDSVAAGNGAGFVVFGNVQTARMFMERDTATGNNIGIATLGGQAVVSNSTIVDNTTGLAADAPLISRGNNTLTGNTSDGAFTGTLAAAYRSP